AKDRHPAAVVQPPAGRRFRAGRAVGARGPPGSGAALSTHGTDGASRVLPAAEGAGRWWASSVTSMVVALVLLAAWSLTVGAYPVTLSQALQAVLDRLGSIAGGAAETTVVASTVDTVLFGIRLPRLAAAIVVGGCLA